jgi:hypothetical protein
MWDAGHEVTRAEFERRCALIEREAAQLDGERAELERLRARGLRQRDTDVNAEIDRVAGEIERRSVRLQADDSALEQERVRLWPRHDRPEPGRPVRAATAPRGRDGSENGPSRGRPGAADDAVGIARRVTAQTRENAKHLSSVLSRTANALEMSAALAESNAERLERLGRADAGAEERRAADRGQEAARRARLHAEEWLRLSEGTR